MLKDCAMLTFRLFPLQNSVCLKYVLFIASWQIRTLFWGWSWYKMLIHFLFFRKHLIKWLLLCVISYQCCRRLPQLNFFWGDHSGLAIYVTGFDAGWCITSGSLNLTSCLNSQTLNVFGLGGSEEFTFYFNNNPTSPQVNGGLVIVWRDHLLRKMISPASFLESPVMGHGTWIWDLIGLALSPNSISQITWILPDTFNWYP